MTSPFEAGLPAPSPEQILRSNLASGLSADPGTNSGMSQRLRAEIEIDKLIDEHPALLDAVLQSDVQARQDFLDLMGGA